WLPSFGSARPGRARRTARIARRAGSRGDLRAPEHRVVGRVDERLRPFGRQPLREVLRRVDVLLPHLARQLVEHLDAVTVGVLDVDAVGHAVVHAAQELHALLLEELDLLEPRLAVGPGDGHVVEAHAPGLHAPRVWGAVLRRRLGQRQVVVRDPAVRIHAAVEAHLEGPILELGHLAEADDLGPELVRDLEVTHVEDEVVDAAGRDGAVTHRLSPWLTFWCRWSRGAGTASSAAVPRGQR